MRAFASLFCVCAWVLAYVSFALGASLPWVAVCVGGALIGLATAVWRPLLLPSVAYAGMTVTWAGLRAGQLSRGASTSELQFFEACVMMFLCVCTLRLIVEALQPAPAPSLASRTQK